MTDAVGVLDELVTRVLAAYPYRFTIARTPDEREQAFRIRYDVVTAAGWTPAESFADGLEHDEDDKTATLVLGWAEDRAICTGRVILPPAPLPTERLCGLRVEPAGGVVEVGRMSVAPTYPTYRQAAFIALLCRLYLEMRSSDHQVACGMMSPRVRNLLRQLGVQLEVLGPDREHWGEQRAPVRFGLTVNALSLGNRWAGET